MLNAKTPFIVEGNILIDTANKKGVEIEIKKNNKKIWHSKFMKSENPK